MKIKDIRNPRAYTLAVSNALNERCRREVKTNHDDVINSEINSAFWLTKSPEGWEYWHNIYHNNPR